MEPICVFIDESGDIGYPKGSSFLTIAALITRDRKRIERIPLQIRKKRLKKTINRKTELKFYNSEDKVRRGVLSLLMKHGDFLIVAVIVDKNTVAKRHWDDKENFYDECCARLAGDVAILDLDETGLNLVFDRRYNNKELNDVFASRILDCVGAVRQRSGCTSPPVRISLLDSQGSRGLQVADYIAGAIRRKYEQKDATYYDIIAERIIYEDRWFVD